LACCSNTTGNPVFSACAGAREMTSQSLTYLIRIDGATRDSTLKGYEGWFSDEYTLSRNRRCHRRRR
jgi:hypothetical protein